jgi:hypothetical protein
MMNVVGYPEEDKFNKVPKYCSRCRKQLVTMTNERDKYDPFNGRPISADFLICPTLSALHDRWKRERFGAWVNYGYDQ